MAKKRKEKKQRNSRKDYNGFKKHRVVKRRRPKTIVRSLGNTMQYYSNLIGMGSKWLTSAPSKMFKILEEEAKDKKRNMSLTTSDKMTVASIVTFFLCNQYSKI